MYFCDERSCINTGCINDTVPSCDITNPLVIHHKARRWSHWQPKRGKNPTKQNKKLLVLKGILNFDNSPTGVSAIWPKGTRENNLNPSQHSKLPVCYKSLAHALGAEREQLRQDRLECTKGSSVTQCWKKPLQYYMLPNTYTSQSLTYLPAKPVSRATKQEKLLQSYCQVLEWLATANFPVHNHSIFSFAMEMLFLKFIL